jgi:TRAP-type C4-dicarboxylate transport system permease small subunit
MRRGLDVLYRASGFLAALFVVGIAAIVALQVALNTADFALGLFRGDPLGLLIPSYTDFTGYFLAAGAFLALAGTFRAGQHIRVEIVVGRLGARARQRVELWCLFVAFCASAYATYYVGLLAYDAWRFGDKSEGMVPVPLWLPQSSLVIGLFVFALALVDAYVRALRPAAPAEPGGDLDRASRTYG